MSSKHPIIRNPIFKSAIEKLLNTWEALKIAIENGQGGGLGKEIQLWMVGAIEEFFYLNDNLDGDEVGEFIGKIMNQEFDTMVEDNSLLEIGNKLCNLFKLSLDPQRSAELLSELQMLDSIALAMSNKPSQASKMPNTEDSSDEEQEEAMDCEEDGAVAGPSTSTNSQPQEKTHRVGSMRVSEPDEDGWSTVGKK